MSRYNGSMVPEPPTDCTFTTADGRHFRCLICGQQVTTRRPWRPEKVRAHCGPPMRKTASPRHPVTPSPDESLPVGGALEALLAEICRLAAALPEADAAESLRRLGVCLKNECGRFTGDGCTTWICPAERRAKLAELLVGVRRPGCWAWRDGRD